MTGPEAPSLYCWDGRTKIATAWTTDTDEPNLRPTDTNCSVYLSHEQSQQQPPSFKIRFDQLVTAQCQPLIRALFCEEPESGTTSTTTISRLSLSGPASFATRSSSTSSACSLILQPPHSANQYEALQYNVTTRNFFAWLVRASIVGTDPTYALIALKLRMDMWRNPSSDNTAAIREYAKQHEYAEPPILYLSTEYDLRNFVPSAPGYKLGSAPGSSQPKSSMNAAIRLRQSFGKRAGFIMKRKSEGMDSCESLPVNSRPSKKHSSEPLSGADRPVLQSEVSSDDSGNSSSVDNAHAGSSNDVASSSSGPSYKSCVSDFSNGSNLSLSTNTPYTPLELPELEDILEPCRSDNDNEEKGKSKGKERATPQTTYTSSLCQLQTSTESPRTYSNSHTRHSSQRDRRRPHSRAGSGPPSPILEEIVLPRRPYAPSVMHPTNTILRRYSFDVGLDYPNHGSRSAHNIVTVNDIPQQVSHSNDHLPASSSYFDSAYQRQNVCATCKRRRKPNSPATTNKIVPTAPAPTQPIPEHEKSCIVDKLARVEADPAQWMMSTLGTEKRQEQENRQDHHRFPSLHGLRTLSMSSATTTKPTVGRAISGSSTPRQSRASSQPPGSSIRSRSRTVSEGVYDNQSSPGRDVKGTPLTEQCYTPSIRSTASTKRRMSHDTMVTISATPPVLAAPSQLDEFTLGVDLGDLNPQHEPTAVPQRTSVPEPFVPAEQVQSPLGVTSPEPTEFPVLMKSNGSRHPLALMLQNENTCMVVSASSPPDKYQPHFSTIRDDTIMLDRLLEGFKFLEYPPEIRLPQHRSKTPTKRAPPNINTTLSPSRLSQLSPASSTTPSTASFMSSRKSWSSSLKRWRSKDATLVEMYDSSPSRRPVSKTGQLQIQVLTMDSTGKFSTEFMDSPVEMGGFPGFR